MYITLKDDSFYHITEDQLRMYTLKLIRMVRESLMYLVYAVGVNESRKENRKKALR